MAKKDGKQRDMQYIQIEEKKGYTGVRIRIRKNGKSFSQQLLVADYGTLSRALAAARKIRNEKLVEMDENRLIVHTPTVNELFEKKFEIMPLALKTQTKHRTIYRDCIEQACGKIPIDKIVIADIQKTVNAYAKTHTEKQTSRCITLWRQIYKTAIMLGYPIPDLTVALIMPKCQPDKPARDNSISLEDFNKILDTVKNYHIYDEEGRYRSSLVWYLLQVLAYTGMRPAEAFALTRKDFHFNTPRGCYISINKAVGSDESKKQQIIHTKTRQSVRDIPMSEELKQICSSLLEWTDKEYVFSSYDGSLIEIDNLCDYIHNISKKAKIPFNMYRLRHVFSTDMLNEGVAPQTVRDLMGHASMNMTLHYAFSTDSDRQKAIDHRRMA